MTSVIGSSLSNLTATLVALVSGFLVSVIASRLLGPTGAGAVAYAVWIAVCASAIADRGFPQMLLRHVAFLQDKGEARYQQIINSAFLSFLPAVCVVFLGFTGYALTLWSDDRQASLLWLATGLLFASYAFAALSIAIARGKGRFRETALLTATGSALQVPVVLLGAVVAGPVGVVLGMLTRYLPQGLALSRHLQRPFRAVPGAVTPDMKAYQRSVWTTDVIDVVLLARIEYVVIGFYLGHADLGYFAAAIAFAGLVTQLTLQLSPVFLVGLSKISAADGTALPQQLYRNGFRLTALVVFPLGLGGAGIISVFLPLVFGQDFQPAAAPAVLFLLASVPGGLAVVPWSYLAAQARAGLLLRLTLLYAAGLFTALALVVPVAGLLGAAAVRLVSELVFFLLLGAAVTRSGGPAVPWTDLLRIFLAAGLCGISAFAVTSAMPSLAGVVIGLVAGAAGFLLGIRLLSVATPDDAMRVERLVIRHAPSRLREPVLRAARLVLGAT
ncbi:lipopolysaccharide biosynthesis protein [Rhizobium sp. RU36D]|uniref:lipopolysaccharide biosynthesis protein n=1 Tax=Rhizobium sp. RU36D TaxID=1907415 RepID=UPI0009D7C5B6|nr:lipopolysaccharide biosynthesis protein [Rhizobium sp. RU36D]SMC53974.1 Membrane protein involved in the export of O-antigen and teichoic acid [Rhizobium sp. RU36D]